MNDMTDEPLEQILARHLGSSRSFEAELSFLASQPEPKREAFEARLRALDLYLAKERASTADVDMAAAKLGVSRRQLYRLIAKVRELGPVSALVPGLQNVPRPSVVRTGLSENVEALLQKHLRQEPDAKIAQLQRLVTRECDQHGLTPPKEWVLKQRVHALRASGLVGPRAQFGAEFIFDQISLDLAIADIGLTARFGILTVIIDRSTKLIAGADIRARDGFGDGMRAALDDMSAQVAKFREARFPVAKSVSAMTWVVPEGRAEQAVEKAEGFNSNSMIEIRDKGRGRHGELIVRMLGDRLGVYPFRARERLSTNGSRAPGRGVSFEDASKLVGYCVEAWNRKLLTHLPVVPDDAVRKRSARLNRVRDEVQLAFQPVLAAIDASLVTTQPREGY